MRYQRQWNVVLSFLCSIICYGNAFPISYTTCRSNKHVISSPKITFLKVASIDNFNSTTANGNKKKQRGNNPMANEIMTYLYRQYNHTRIEDWKKTRNYVYKATMTKKEPLTVTSVELVCQYLNSKFKDLSCSIVQQCPRILRRHVQSQLIPTVDFLETLYKNDMLQQALSRRPDLLLTSGVGYRVSQQPSFVTDDVSSVEDFFQAEIGLSQMDIKILKQSHPAIFAIPVETKIRPLTQYLSSLLSSGKKKTNNKAIMKKVIKNSPRILSLNVDTNLRPKVDFLTNHCGLVDLANLLQTCPGVLGLSLEDNLKPTIAYLQNLLNRDSKTRDVRTELQACLARHPQLLGLSISNIQTKVSYFDSIDDDNSLLLATRVLKCAPSTFSLSLSKNIQPTVECLAHLWGISTTKTEKDSLRKNKEESIKREKHPSNKKEKISLSKRISEYPVILTLSLEGNIQPTLAFYNRTGYIELADEIMENNGTNENSILRGRHIASSLYNRLLPRWNYCFQQQRQSVDDRIPLHLLASASDASFCTQLDLNFDHYQMYKEEFGPRLKFTSQFDTWLKTGRPIDGF